VIARATEVLRALARSDVGALERLCAGDVLLVGTDEGEVWRGRDAVLEGFRDAFDLEVEWDGEPVAHGDWVYGDLLFTLPDGERVPARVTMIFEGGELVHAHYSLAVQP
jgi:hypothetical protein